MGIKIISSNIRFDNPNDGNHVWAARKSILAQNLLDYRPDIIGTQEGKRQQLEELNGLLKEYKLSEDHRRWIPDRMYPSIFFNSLTIEVINSGDIWLSTTPHIPGSKDFNSVFPRLCTWIKGRFKRSKQKFFLANVHLDHSNTETRQKQLMVLINELKQTNDQNFPIILTGDFNEGPKNIVYQKLFEAFDNLYDPWMKFGHKDQISHHNFGVPAEYADRIDWILLPKEFNAHEIFFDTRNESGIYPSDHYPLKCSFDFNPS